jgi:5-keto-L-gluconate epimerase
MTIRIGLAIAPEHALPTAFVVFRDRLVVGIEKAARLGYDAIELALADANECDVAEIKRLLDNHRMSLAAISTGRVFAERKVWMTHPDAAIRRRAVAVVNGLVDLAAVFGSRVNLGRARGFVHEGETRAAAEARFVTCIRACADHAALLGVEILLEPVNRYEINFINSVTEGIALAKTIDRANVRLMPDVFHMNIEDVSILGSLEQAGPLVGYVHFADSNRWAPGQGHLDFPAIVSTLRKMHFDGYVTVEILPHPDPDTAATQAIAYLRTLIPRSEA